MFILLISKTRPRSFAIVWAFGPGMEVWTFGAVDWSAEDVADAVATLAGFAEPVVNALDSPLYEACRPTLE